MCADGLEGPVTESSLIMSVFEIKLRYENTVRVLI
jgi:hypothetical protein